MDRSARSTAPPTGDGVTQLRQLPRPRLAGGIDRRWPAAAHAPPYPQRSGLRSARPSKSRTRPSSYSCTRTPNRASTDVAEGLTAVRRPIESGMGQRTFDVVIAGGGLAGSTLGGVLARSGFGVLVVEKESGFRDRVRGELTWPWGHSEALRAGLGEALDQAGVATLPVLDFYEDGRRVDGVRWGEISLDALPAIGFSHPHLQETFLAWAASQGATVLRPAKVVAVGDGDRPSVTVVEEGRTTEFQARLTVGADGKKSGARRWLRADTISDPEHHWFGGLLVSGVTWGDAFGWATTPSAAVGWFATGTDSCRVYIRLAADRVRESDVGRSVDAFLAFAAKSMPAGSLDGARQVGPFGFFPNNCTWSSRVALGHVVLVGDAAGALDPTQGLGTSLLFRDVRVE